MVIIKALIATKVASASATAREPTVFIFCHEYYIMTDTEKPSRCAPVIPWSAPTSFFCFRSIVEQLKSE